MTAERPFVPDESPKPGSQELGDTMDKLNREGWQDNAVVRVVRKGEDPKKQREILETGGQCKDMRTYLHLHSEQFAPPEEVATTLTYSKKAFDKLSDGTILPIADFGHGMVLIESIRMQAYDGFAKGKNWREGDVLVGLYYKSNGSIKKIDIRPDLIDELGTREGQHPLYDTTKEGLSDSEKNRLGKLNGEAIARLSTKISNDLVELGFSLSDHGIEKEKERLSLLDSIEEIIKHRKAEQEKQTRKKKDQFEF